MTAREAAVRALMACEAQGAWSDMYLNGLLKKEKFGGRDRALAARLCYGSLQNTLALKWYIEKYLSGGNKYEKLQPAVRMILITAVYQLIFMDRIPARAAVYEAVEMAGRLSNRGAASLVNAVLRNLTASIENETLPSLPEEDWSIKFSHPKEFIDYFTKVIGSDKTRLLLEADNSVPEITVRVNSLKQATCIPDSRPHPWLDGYRVLEGSANITESEAYKNGLITVQDAAAALPVLAAAPSPGQRVLDACAAPGGKSFLAAQLMNNEGFILSTDINASKLRHIREGCDRLGITIIEAKAMDASVFDSIYHESFDIVLADVPCSGFGVIRKKPEIRYKSFESIRRLPEVQYKILDNLAAYVKPGGVLLYSTCTLLREENEAVTDRFLSQHSEYRTEGFDLPEPVGSVRRGQITIWPFEYGTDGFYICKLRKKM